jgi:CRP-like cAMP-binding protein
MTIEADIAFLEGVPVFRTLGGGALRILAIGAESHTVQAGRVLFTAGEVADCAYVVQLGSFGLRPQGQEAEIIAAPGTLLGEMALLAETIRPVTATAREDAAVMRISRTMFLKMLESYPDAAQRLCELITARADRWAREMEQVRAALAHGAGPR